MAKFRKVASRSVQKVDTYFSRLRNRIKYVTGFGRSDEISIDAYWGYGRKDYLFLKGRILEDEKIIITEKDSTWRNLVNSYKRFESDEIPNAKVRVEYLGNVFEAITDKEGFFTIDVSFKNDTIEPKYPLQKVEVHLYEVPGYEDVSLVEKAYVMVPKPTAEYGVISDIDDTVLKSYVTSPLMAKTAYHTFFKSAKSRMSFAGAPELYRALRKGSDGQRRNPIFYVSNSPYNLFDFLIAFLETAKLPLGPILLRDFGLFKKHKKGKKSEKYESIAHILGTYPELSFILIGDSGEKDADIYQDITRAFPNRIKAIYIRDVQSKKRTKRIKGLMDAFKDVTMILANDSATIEKHALKQGFIQAKTLKKAKEKFEENVAS